ncbi:MAG: DUF2953 domain-containing protein [Ruminococcus sp.]|nr:DUF2953 domain-containing protein [Ruminococcus sp.]
MFYIILGIILLLFLIILKSSVKLNLRYIEGKLGFEVKFWFFIIYPRRKRTKKRVKSPSKSKSKRKAKSAVTDETAPEPDGQETETITTDESDPEQKSKRSLKEIIHIIDTGREKMRVVLGSTHKGVRRLLRGLVVDNVVIDITAAGDDAHQAAILYGYCNALVYNIIALARTYVSILISEISINCDYLGKDSLYNIKFSVKIPVSVLLSSGVLIGWGVWTKRKDIFGKKEIISEGI